jgi:membrane protein required for colicin V production
MSGFTFLDAILIGVALLSGLLAMYRGVTREVLSIVSWGVAALAVLAFIKYQSKFAEEVGHEIGLPGGELVAKVGIGAIIFVIVLIIVHLLTARISDTILDSRIGLIDRVLGFGFGVLRGFILVLIPFMFYQHFNQNRDQQYAFVSKAKSYDLLLSSGNALKPTLMELIDRVQSKGGEQQG